MNFLENEIKKIISNYKGLSYIDVENSGEGSLFGISIDYLDTLMFTEDEYIEWEEFLDDIDIISTNFQIYCSWDRSGYDFWTNKQEESNHTYLDIWISDDFADNDIKPLFVEVDNILQMIEDFYFSIKK